jgi:hypothetical protein
MSEKLANCCKKCSKYQSHVANQSPSVEAFFSCMGCGREGWDIL